MGFEYNEKLDEALKFTERSRIEPVDGGDANSLDTGTPLSHTDHPSEKPIMYGESYPNEDEEKANLISASGSQYDDIMVIGTINDDKSTENQGRAYGGSGHDTVVVHGDRASYMFHLPSEPSQYAAPRSDVWDNANSIYGRLVIIENVDTGDRVMLNGVENIIFDPQKQVTRSDDYETPLETGALQSGLKDGSIMQISRSNALKAAEDNGGPKVVARAKLAASYEASNEIDHQGDFLKGEDLQALNNNVIEYLQENPPASSINPIYEGVDQPVSPNTLTETGISFTPSP